MSLQLIKDGMGKNTGVFIPMSDWDMLVNRHEDLRLLIPAEAAPKKRLSEFAGTLSDETAKDMLKYVEESRQEWEERLKKQFE
jgi:hypothetical protein